MLEKKLVKGISELRYCGAGQKMPCILEALSKLGDFPVRVISDIGVSQQALEGSAFGLAMQPVEDAEQEVGTPRLKGLNSTTASPFDPIHKTIWG